MLELKQINAYYGMSHVLFDLSMSVDIGRVVCLLGRNGAGKSTTIKCIMSLVKIKGGEVIFQGESILGVPTHEISQKGIGYVPEDRRIFSDLTVLENLYVGQKSTKGREGVWTLEKIFCLFPTLEKLSHRKGGRLSGGEQQMLAVARTLMGNPQLLLLDEPSEGLAPLVVKAMKDQILLLKKEEVTILLSEQNLKFATSVGDLAYIIEKGGIRFHGTIDEVNESEEIRTTYLAV